MRQPADLPHNSTPRRILPRKKRRSIEFYLLVTPWILGFVLLNIFPLLVGFLTSLSNYDGLNLATVRFEGFENYIKALEDIQIPLASERTLLWLITNVPAGLLISFILALLLHQVSKGRGIFRTVFYLPSVIPLVATVWVWRIFLDQNAGLANGILSLIRPGTAVPWLTNHSFPVLVLVSVWIGLGTGVVIFLAGLQDIPTEYLDAARIDGANKWQLFRYITVPLVTPIIFFQFILALLGSLQTLVLPLLLFSSNNTQGSFGVAAAVPRDSYLFMVHAVQQMFVYQRYGYGSALIWILSLFMIGLIIIAFWSQRFWVYTEMGYRGKK